jgi:hypothetical protein
VTFNTATLLVLRVTDPGAVPVEVVGPTFVADVAISASGSDGARLPTAGPLVTVPPFVCVYAALLA